MGVALPEGYKDSPVGFIPLEWELIQLQDIAGFITKGSTPTTYGFEWVGAESGIPFLRSECVTDNGFSAKGLNYISKEAHDTLERSQIESGDLLMTITGNIGRVARLPESIPEANINQHIAKIRVSSEATDAAYVLQALKRDEYAEHFGKILTGQAYPQISLAQVRNTPLPLPPLPEQKKIARILSTVDSKLALIDQQITATQTLKKGLMQKLFSEGVGTQDANGQWQPHTEFKDSELGRIPAGWGIASAGKHINLLSGFPFKSSNYVTSENNAIRLLRGDNIVQGWLRWRDAKFWPSDDISELSKYFMQEGDLVIAMDRTWVSSGLKVSQVNKSDLPCLLVQRVSRIRAKESYDQTLLKHNFSGYRFEQYVKGVQTDSVVPHISSKQIQEFLIVLPPKNEQEQIAKILTTVDCKLTQLTTQKTQTKQLKKGLMQKLLTGQIRVAV